MNDHPLEIDSAAEVEEPWLDPLSPDALPADLLESGDAILDLDPGPPSWSATDASPSLVGDPGSDMAVWHQQERADSCAVAAQEFVLDAVTGRDFSESELVAQAEAHGWYTPGGGTPLEATGNLIEANGVPVERFAEGTMDDLERCLAEGERVVVGVDSSEVWEPGSGIVSDDLFDYPMPGQGADHAIEVIGVDRGHPSGPVVIVNDPGHPDGAGMMVPLDEFEGAWADSGHFMVATDVVPSGAGAVA